MNGPLGDHVQLQWAEGLWLPVPLLLNLGVSGLDLGALTGDSPACPCTCPLPEQYGGGALLVFRMLSCAVGREAAPRKLPAEAEPRESLP